MKPDREITAIRSTDLNTSNLQLRQVLSMPCFTLGVFAPAHFNDPDLFPADLRRHLGEHLSSINIGRSDGSAILASYQQYTIEFQRLAWLDIKFFDVDRLPGNNFILLAPCLDDSKHSAYSGW